MFHAMPVKSCETRPSKSSRDWIWRVLRHSSLKDLFSDIVTIFFKESDTCWMVSWMCWHSSKASGETHSDDVKATRFNTLKIRRLKAVYWCDERVPFFRDGHWRIQRLLPWKVWLKDLCLDSRGNWTVFSWGMEEHKVIWGCINFRWSRCDALKMSLKNDAIGSRILSSKHGLSWQYIEIESVFCNSVVIFHNEYNLKLCLSSETAWMKLAHLKLKVNPYPKKMHIMYYCTW